MQSVILAGGRGTRISEESLLRPKPLIEIGGKPIIWHIMKHYSLHGINDFIICCGYKGYIIKEYFANYFLHMSDVTLDISKNSMEVHKKDAEKWKITLIDTGEKTKTGGRLKRVSQYLEEESNFCFTYGDGLSNLDISESIKFHLDHKKKVTVGAVQVKGRYGTLDCTENKVNNFSEKAIGENSYINGGFFVVSKDAISLIENDDTSWEEKTLKELAVKNEIMAFKHHGFWHPMDTLRDKNHLEELWSKKKAPWKIWS